MPTPVKRIEKDFLIKVLYDEEIPVIYHQDHDEFTLMLEEPAKTRMVFRPGRPIKGLGNSRLDLKFSYRGSVIRFTAEAARIKDGLIVCNIPESLYKESDPLSQRVNAPADMRMQFTVSGTTGYGEIIDISASGLLFAWPRSSRPPALPPDGALMVKIITPRRSVTAAAKITRRFEDASADCFDCSFTDMAPEDIRFLFEYIYGKPYTGTETLQRLSY